MKWNLIYIVSQIFVIINYSIIASTYYANSRKKILVLNICNTIAEMIADLLLGGYTGIAMCIVAIIRNTYFYIDENKNGKKERNTKKDILVLILLYIIIIVLTAFTYDGFFSLLIVFATLIYTFSVWQKSTLIYKILGVPNQLLYIAYNIYLKSIFGIILESILLICSCMGYILEIRKKKDKMKKLECNCKRYNSDAIKLVKPAKNHEKQAIEYKKEHFENGEITIHGTSKWDKLDNYNEWLELLEKNSKKETVQEGWTISTEFFGVRELDNKIVGMINIRHDLTNDFLKNYAGHIGYGIRPSERRKGYVTQMLKQALQYCKEELGLDKVMINCTKENEASRKTIINAGGKLEREYQTENGENVQIYWVNI